MILQRPQFGCECVHPKEASREQTEKERNGKLILFEIPQYQLLNILHFLFFFLFPFLFENFISTVQTYGKQTDSLGCAQLRHSKTIEFNMMLKGVICFESFTFDWNEMIVLSVHICIWQQKKKVFRLSRSFVIHSITTSETKESKNDKVSRVH